MSLSSARANTSGFSFPKIFCALSLLLFSVASVYALEGMQAEAFEWLGRAIALGNENQPCFENDPNWSSLKSDPRFQDLMEKVRASHTAPEIKHPATE